MGEPVIRIRNLRKVIDGREILKGINLDIYEGEIFVIIGGSGSGKSTLLKHIVGLWKPTEGCVCVFGQNLAELDEQELDKIRLKMGYVFQEGALFDFLKVWENVGFYYLEHTNLPKPVVRKKAIELLRQVDLDEKVADLYPSQLSGGMKKRVSTARAIAGEGRIILYDEPTSGLDPVTSRNIDRLIVSLRDRLGSTSVVVTHDMISAVSIADRIGFIYKGELLEVGTPEQILNSKNPLVREFVEKGLYGLKRER
ncbi:MAG: ATP-binding cassette domain-containing protein [Aquificae bacterium]|nr:ATP-binding cassette domain-containing protein [Aquificota bacterium]